MSPRLRPRLYGPDGRPLGAPALLTPERSAHLALPSIGVKGVITAEVVHAATGHVRQRLTFPNTLTTAFLDRLMGGQSTMSSVFGHDAFNNNKMYLGVGTGGSDPTPAQTSLDAQVGGRTRNNGGFLSTTAAGNGWLYWYTRTTWVFTEAEANGNLTELGGFLSSSGGTMVFRQLFRDALGTPVVVTKTASDQLRIIYEFRHYLPATVSGAALTIGGVEYQVDSRPSSASQQVTWAPALTSFGAWSTNPALIRAWENPWTGGITAGWPSGASALASALTHAAYVAGSLVRETEVRWEPGVANYTNGIACVNAQPPMGGDSYVVFNITPRIPKLDTQRLLLTVQTSIAEVDVAA